MDISFGDNRIVGIDFGTRLLKLAEVSMKRPKPLLRNYGFVYLPNEMTIGEEAGKLIGLTAENLGIKARDAHISIPLSSVFIAPFNLPKLDPKEIKDAVALEAKRYLPVNLSDVYLDWQYVYVEEGASDKPKTRVFLVATPRDILSQYRRMLETAGLRLAHPEFFGFSLARVTQEIESFSVIVDVSYRPASALFVKGGGIYDLKQLKFGAANVDASLAELFQMSPDRVEDIKEQVGLLPYPEYQEATKTLTSMADSFFYALNAEIEAFEFEFRANVERVFFTGGGAALKGFLERAIDKLPQRKTLWLNPFALVAYDPTLEEVVAERRPILSGALCVALSGLKR